MAETEASAWATGLAELARDLDADLRDGLSAEEATRRLAADGVNELRRAAGISPLRILARQFRSLVVWLLVAAALASLALGEVADGAAILAIVALNAGRPVAAAALVTDGLPALALATDPIDPGVLERPPRPPAAELLDRRRLGAIALTGCLTAAVAFGAFAFELESGGGIAAARNAAFSTLVFAELLRAFGARSETRLVHEVGLFSNLRLFAIVAASFSLQIWIHHSPLLGSLFDTEPITLAECAEWVALGTVPLLAVELSKWVRRMRSAAARPAGSPRPALRWTPRRAVTGGRPGP